MENNFAKILKELRLEKKLTMMQLADKTKLSYTSIQSWESGRSIPIASAVIILADFFGVTTDYLLGRTDN